MRFSVLLQRQKQSKELILQQERAYPRLYWSLRTALRPLIDAHGQQLDLDLASPVGNNGGNNSGGSSCSSTASSVGNAPTGVNNQQKRQRRAKTNSVSVATTQYKAQEHDDNDETDEEPVL